MVSWRRLVVVGVLLVECSQSFVVTTGTCTHSQKNLFAKLHLSVPKRASLEQARSSLFSNIRSGAESVASTETKNRMKFIQGIREIVEDYDVFLLDMWGVMHDGFVPYASVLETVKELRNAGKTLIILSNSSKRKTTSIKMLEKLGFDPSDFDKVITSGEVSFKLLSEERLTPGPSAKNAVVFGSGDDDKVYCREAGWSISSIEEADWLVARGTFTVLTDSTTVHKQFDGESSYDSALADALKLASGSKIPMIVTNPDKIRPDFERPPMPGKIGDAYQALDDSLVVKRIGKPFPEVYEAALEGLEGRRVCMVGDALETDVTGGAMSGIDSLWVLADGVYALDLSGEDHLEQDASNIIETFNSQEGTYWKTQNRSGEQKSLVPTLCISHFRW